MELLGLLNTPFSLVTQPAGCSLISHAAAAAAAAGLSLILHTALTRSIPPAVPPCLQRSIPPTIPTEPEHSFGYDIRALFAP